MDSDIFNKHVFLMRSCERQPDTSRQRQIVTVWFGGFPSFCGALPLVLEGENPAPGTAQKPALSSA